MALTRTALFTSGIVALAQDIDTTVPPSGGVTVTNGAGYKVIEIVLGLSSADKLAAAGTKTLTASSYFSSDAGVTWKFINRIDWKSYGPAGYTFTDLDGVVWVNRDPTFTVSLNGLPGTRARLVYHAHGIAQSTGLVVNGLK